jgi:hypothetical protein
MQVSGNHEMPSGVTRIASGEWAATNAKLDHAARASVQMLTSQF